MVNQQAVAKFLKKKSQNMFLTAVLPCGAANVAQRADFIYENLMIQNNVIHNSFLNNVKNWYFWFWVYVS